MNDTTASLVIVGEQLQHESLAEQLALDGYAVRTAADRAQLRALAESVPVYLIVLGAGAPSCCGPSAPEPTMSPARTAATTSCKHECRRCSRVAAPATWPCCATER